MKTTSLSLILASLFATSFASVNVAAPLSEAEEAFSIPADMPTVLTPNSTGPVKVEKTNKNTPYHAYVHRSKERFASVSTSLYPGKDAKPDVALVLQSGTVTTPASAYLKDSTEPANSDYDNPTSFTKRADIDHSLNESSSVLKELKRSTESSYTQITPDRIALGTVKGPTDQGSPNIVLDNKTSTLSAKGIKAGNGQVKEVADGTDDTDAVNVRQLKAAVGSNSAYADTKWVKAGIAQAMATAGLPQPTAPGKSMISGSLSTYRQEGGFAIGFSHVTQDNAKVFKVNGSGDTRGNFGMTVGGGFQW